MITVNLRYLLIGVFLFTLLTSLPISATVKNGMLNQAICADMKKGISTSYNTGYGVVSLPVLTQSCEARKHFLLGLAMLFNFEFPIAREEFLKAQTADPDFALAYWGEAMTWDNPHERTGDKEAAINALKKLSSTQEGQLNKANTPLAKGLMHALQRFLWTKDPRKSRLLYAKEMEKISQKYPDHSDIQALYAAAIMGVREHPLDFTINDKIYRITKKIIEKNPRHAGAIHYMIHAYENPLQAAKALPYAKQYPHVAPKSQHAVHMPSHQYFALGMWDALVQANTSSWGLSKAVVKKHSHFLNKNYKEHHGLNWLMYAYLQKGQYQAAKEQLLKMSNDVSDNISPKRWHYARMRADYIIETNDNLIELPYGKIKTSDLEASAAVADLYADALMKLNKNNITGAKSNLKKIYVIIEYSDTHEPYHKIDDVSFTDATIIDDDNQDGDAPANYWRIGALASKIMASNLSAYIQLAENKHQQAIDTLKQSIFLEDKLDYVPGPSIIIKPSSEILGEVLLTTGNPVKAHYYFTRTLDSQPNRSRSVLGLANASKAAGYTEQACRHYKQYLYNMRDADQRARVRNNHSIITKYMGKYCKH